MSDVEPSCPGAGISVVIPIRNARDTIGELLESLCAQSISTFQVVLADNGSTDDSAAEVARFRSRFEHLVTIDASERRGPGYARRAGAEAAEGEHLLFIDADDTVGTTFVEAMTDALRVGPFVHAAMDMRQHNPAWFCDGDPGLGAVTPDVGGWKYAYGGTLGVTRSAYDDCGGWAPENGLGDDTDFCWRMRHVGHDLRCVPEAVVHRRGRHTASAAWRQGRWYGRHHATSNRMWRPKGLPVESEWTLVARTVALARTAPLVRSKRERLFWLKEAGIVSARLQYDLVGLVQTLVRKPLRDVLDVCSPSSDPTLDRFRNVRVGPPTGQSASL
jgi:glycosyltransferase involved in cell wall biosynthesis